MSKIAIQEQSFSQSQMNVALGAGLGLSAGIQLEDLPVPMLLVEPCSLRIIDANEAARNLFKMPLAHLRAVLQQQLPAEVHARIALADDAGLLLSDYQVRLMLNQQLRFLRLSVCAVYGQQPPGGAVWLIAQDVTDAIMSQQAQRHQVMQFRDLAERLNTPAWMVDGTDTVVWHNEAYQNVLAQGYMAAGGFVLSNPLTASEVFSDSRWSNMADQALATQSLVEQEVVVEACGTWHVMMFPLPGVKSGTSQVGAIALNTRPVGADDMDARIAREQQVAREQVRAAVARELHDNLGPELTLLGLDVARLAQDVNNRDGHDARPALRSSWDPHARGVLDNVYQRLCLLEEQVLQTARITRRIVHDYRGPQLNSDGFAAAAARLTSSFCKSADLVGKIEVLESWVEPDDELAVHLHRVLQEMLNNVTRHAVAKRFLVRMGMSEAGRWIEGADDGIGLPQAVSGGAGLRSLRERAAILGGHVEVKTRPEVDGTTVRVTFPSHAKRLAA